MNSLYYKKQYYSLSPKRRTRGNSGSISRIISKSIRGITTNTARTTSRRNRQALSQNISKLSEQSQIAQTAVKTTLKETAKELTQAISIAKKVASSNGKQVFEFNSAHLMACLGITAILLGLAQLTFSTATVTKGYELKRLQADQQQLITEYEVKNMQLAEVKALNTIANSTKTDSMRRPAEIAYIKAPGVLASK